MQDRQKHTPGPWIVAESERTLRQQLAMGGIAVKAHAPKYDTDCAIFNISTNPTFGGNDMTIANARLIAAAPDMLAALKALHVCHRAFSGSQNWGMLDDEARTAAEAAIAKAEAV